MFVFNSYKDKNFKDCWDLSNLRFMWGPDNIKKSSIYNGKRRYYGN